MIQLRLTRRTLALVLVAFVLVAATAVTALVRTAGAGGSFTDTPPWIANHAEWLAANGIANGFSDGSFKPDGNITRGQAAFWLGNYNDSITQHETPFTSDATAGSASVWAACPPGKRAIGGGGEVNEPFWEMRTSRPWTGPPIGSGWYVEWGENASEVSAGDQPGDVYVVCAPDPVSQPPG